MTPAGRSAALKTPRDPQVRPVMDIRDAAAYLGVSADALYRYASEGVIPAFRLGNRWRFQKALLDKWMSEQSVKGVVKGPVRHG